MSNPKLELVCDVVVMVVSLGLAAGLVVFLLSLGV